MIAPDLNTLTGEQILVALQNHAADVGASDIHLSPEKSAIRVEMRLHGVLAALPPITHDRYEEFMRCLKFQSKLKLNVTNAPQDGQYTFAPAKGSEIVNVRIATLPSRFGETVTMRILDPARGMLTLQALGFDPAMQNELQKLITLPHGLILVTGPTGSGKTTTLYALLQLLIGTARNIITLEDPIEYEIPGIVQSEVDLEHGYTFAGGLRSILRHDPNVILVGEIRDRETAQTAIDASLTGHLVLSTLHTNNAVEAIPRLLTMGITPYTFAPSLRAIIAQRLVRTLSAKARLTMVDRDPADPSLYDGRRVIAELLIASAKMRTLIQEQATEAAMAVQARDDGLVPMKDVGERLVREGITTVEEVLRVTM